MSQRSIASFFGGRAAAAPAPAAGKAAAAPTPKKQKLEDGSAAAAAAPASPAPAAAAAAAEAPAAADSAPIVSAPAPAVTASPARSATSGAKRAFTTAFGDAAAGSNSPAKGTNSSAAAAKTKSSSAAATRRQGNIVVDDDDDDDDVVVPRAAKPAAAATAAAAAPDSDDDDAAHEGSDDDVEEEEEEDEEEDEEMNGTTKRKRSSSAAAGSSSSSASSSAAGSGSGGKKKASTGKAAGKGKRGGKAFVSESGGGGSTAGLVAASQVYHPIADAANDWARAHLAKVAAAAAAAAGASGGAGTSSASSSSSSSSSSAAKPASGKLGGGGSSSAGGPPSVPYGVLVAAFTAIEATTKRIAITTHITQLLRSIIAVAPGDLLPAIYLCTNTLAPAFESLELGVGDSILVKALAEATGRQPKDIKSQADEKGDLGLVAEASRAKQRTLFGSLVKAPAATSDAAAPAAAGGAAPHSSLTIRSVYEKFRAIAQASGKASQDTKVGIIKQMLVTCNGIEARYIVRGLQGKLRIGLAKQTVLVALAHAFALTTPVPPAEVASADAANTFSLEGAEDEDEDEHAGPPVAGQIAGLDVVASPLLPDCLLAPAVRDDAAQVTVGSGDVADAAAAVLLTRPVPQAGGGPSVASTVILDVRSVMRSTAVELRVEIATVVLKQLWSELPSYNVIIPALLSGGIPRARAVCSLQPGVPVTPMLAKPTKGVREVLDRFEGVPFTCEYKYDGERAQVHRTPSGAISIFSRNSENTTSKYPDLHVALEAAMGLRDGPAPAAGAAAAAAAAAGAASVDEDASASSSSSSSSTSSSSSAGAWGPVTSCVLDGEVVAYDREKDKLLPFQILSTRARKDVALDSIKVQVIYVAFDLLYINGHSLLHTPLSVRRQILRSCFREVPGLFAFAQHKESADVTDIQTFLNDAVTGGCEGLMVKVLNGRESVYEPSKRSLNWLKLKKDYMDGLTDSLDLVPIGAWVGKGKRTGTYGAYLLACYDPEEETFQAITKIGTGFSDEMLAELTKAFKEKPDCIKESKPSNVMAGDMKEAPDVWFDPDASEVWEVMAADLSISPVHMAAFGKVSSEKGIALRFPRFLRRRDDKGPVDATNADQVADMYRSQASVSALANDDDDVDM